MRHMWGKTYGCDAMNSEGRCLSIPPGGLPGDSLKKESKICTELKVPVKPKKAARECPLPQQEKPFWSITWVRLGLSEVPECPEQNS